MFRCKEIEEGRVPNILTLFKNTKGSLPRHAWTDSKTGYRIEIGGSAWKPPKKGEQIEEVGIEPFGIRRGYIAIHDKEGESDFEDNEDVKEALEEMGIYTKNLILARIEDGQVTVFKNKKNTTMGARKKLEEVLDKLGFTKWKKGPPLQKVNYLVSLRNSIVVPHLLKRRLVSQPTLRELAKKVADMPEIFSIGIEHGIGARGWKQGMLSSLVQGAKYSKRENDEGVTFEDSVHELERRVAAGEIDDREAVRTLMNEYRGEDTKGYGNMQHALKYLEKSTWMHHVEAIDYLNKTKTLEKRVRKLDRDVNAGIITDKEAVDILMNEFKGEKKKRYASIKNAFNYLGKSKWAGYVTGAVYLRTKKSSGKTLEKRVDELQRRVDLPEGHPDSITDRQAVDILMKEYKGEKTEGYASMQYALNYIGKSTWGDHVRGAKYLLKETNLKKMVQELEEDIKGGKTDDRKAVETLTKKFTRLVDLAKAMRYLGKNTWANYITGIRYLEKEVKGRKLKDRISELQEKVKLPKSHPERITDREAVDILMKEYKGEKTEGYASMRHAFDYLKIGWTGKLEEKRKGR